MSFEDKTLTCSDCNNSFTFSAEEQNYCREAITMSPSAARHAVRHGKQTASAMVAAGVIVMATAAIAPTLPARCFPRCALIAVRKLQYRSSLNRTGRYTAATATVK